MARLLATAALIAAACGVNFAQATSPSRSRQTAQTTAPRVSPQAAGTGSVSGVVRAAATGAPVARARVTLASSAIDMPRVAITSGDGRYTFDKLPAGSYTVQASGSGYAAQFHGQRPSGSPTAVQLGEAQRVERIDIDLAADRKSVV